MRPTLVRRDILANSMANAGVSTILSFKTFEHLLELYKAVIYRSRNVTREVTAVSWLVKTACWSENIQFNRSYWTSTRVSGSASLRFIGSALRLRYPTLLTMLIC